MRAKFLKRICSAILATSMLISVMATMVVFSTVSYAIKDEDIPASVELGKGFNLLECKTFESANLKSAVLFNSVDTLNPTKVRIGNVESNMTYITSMSSYLDNTHTDVSAEVGVTKEGLLAKAEIKAKFGFKGEWESSGKVNTSRLILEIIAKAYKYSLNMEMSDPWAKNEEGEYISINPTFAYDLVHMRPEALFDTYGTHIVTQYDAGGEAYTTYEGTDASNSMKSEFDITANAEVKVSAAEVADVNVSVNTSGGEKHEESFANNNKQTSMRVRGGDPFYSTFDKIIAGDSDETINNWLQSMFTMDENTGSTKAAMIQTDELKLMPLWELLEMDYGQDHSKRVAQLRDYFQENANREYLELYEEFIYGIPGDYADNYDVVQKAFVTDEKLEAVENAPTDRIAIYTEAELNKIGKSEDYPLDGKYTLMRDIELNYDFGGIGYTNNKTIEPFTGDFDGNGHTIYNLNPVARYNGTSEVYMGFVLYNKGKVYNLRFMDSNDDCREAKKTTTSIKSNVANSATAYLGLVIGRNEAEANTSNVYNIYVDNATFIVKNAPVNTYFGLVAGTFGGNVFTENVTVVNSYIDVAGTADNGTYYIGAVCGMASKGSGMVSHDNVVKCDKNAYVGGCLGYFDSTNAERQNTFAYDNEVESANSSNRQLSGGGDLNAYSFGGSDVYALTNEKLFKYYCNNSELVGGMGGYAEEWKEHSETESKPWLIVHAPDGMTAYQNSLISMKNLKIYFAEYGDNTALFEDVTDRVNFVYDFSEVAENVPVTVVYGKHIVEFTVDVLEPVVTDIAVTNKGKTQFRVGELFDNSAFAGQILYSNMLTGSLSANDDGLKVYIPDLEGDKPIDVGEYKFIDTTTGTDVVVEYKGCRTTYQISVLPEDLTGKLHFSSKSVESAPGGEFEVTIDLNNNPGLVALSAYIEYNNDLFEVVEVVDGEILNSFYSFTDYKPSVPLLWMDERATEDNTKSGKLVTVKFKVKEGNYDAAVYGMHTIKCVNGEAVNKAGKSIEIPDMAVKVKLNETAVGDVDSNSSINIWDAVLLTQHIFDTPRSVINLTAADINRDGKVNYNDSSYLNRHMVGFFGLTGAPGKFDVRVKSDYFADEILTGLVVNNPLPQPEEKLGYIFRGYYSDAAYENKIEVLPEASVKEMVIYAKYEQGYLIESDLELVNNIHVYGKETTLVHKGDENADISWNVYDGDTLAYEKVTSIPANFRPSKGIRVEKFVEDLTGRIYSVTYVENGVECTYTTANPTTYTYGVSTKLNNPVSADNNIKFMGWYDNAEFKGETVTDLISKSGDITLYAKWEYKTIRVSLDPKGGSLTSNVLTHTYGTETILPIPTHTNPAYKFVRWVWNDRGIIRYLESIPAVPHYLYDGFGYELYAQWSYEPTIKLTLTGSATDPDYKETEVRENIDAYTTKYSIAEPPATFVQADDGEMYRFAGWYSTETGAFVTEQYLENVEIDLNLTAKWEWQDTNIYIDFCDTDGVLIETAKVNYAEDLTMAEGIEAPAKEGYVLAGWTTEPFNDETGYLPYYPFCVPLDGVQDGKKNYKFYAYWLPENESRQFTYSNNSVYYRIECPTATILDTDITVGLRNSKGPIKTVPYAKLCVPKSVEQFEKAFFVDVSDPEVNGLEYSAVHNGAPGLSWIIDNVSNIKNLVRYYHKGGCQLKGGCGFEGFTTFYVYPQAAPFHSSWCGGTKCNTGKAISKEEFATKFPAPTKEGYTFAGWYDNFEYAGDPITEIPATHKGDMVLFAKWVEDTTAASIEE